MCNNYVTYLQIDLRETISKDRLSILRTPNDKLVASKHQIEPKKENENLHNYKERVFKQVTVYNIRLGYGQSLYEYYKEIRKDFQKFCGKSEQPAELTVWCFAFLENDIEHKCRMPAAYRAHTAGYRD